MGIFDFGTLSTSKVTDLAALANASYAGESPPSGSGWTTLTGDDVGFVEGFNTGTYSGDTFVGSSLWFGAPAARLYKKGNELTISFRGTDSGLDFVTYLDIVGNNNYINAFNSFLNAAQNYAEANDIGNINVTGHSLGAAAANILRNVSVTKNEGFFNDASYLTIATPKVSSNPNIFNIGFENDWVFESIARNTPFVSSDFFSATDNLILYDNEYSEDGFPGLLFDPGDVSAHSATGYVKAIKSISESTFYDLMERDSVVLVVDTDNQVTDKETSISDHFGQSAFYVGRSVADDILGGQAEDFIDGSKGNDQLEGAGGDDQIDGGEGDQDTAVFSGDCLEYDITRSAEGVVLITHARGSMVDGMDTLTNVEIARFSDGKEIDLTAEGLHGCTSLGFIQDFVTGTTQDTQVVFDLERMGDTSYDIEVFVDGQVTTGNAVFNDFFYTIPAGEDPQLILGASVAEVFGDVAFDFEISLQVVEFEQFVTITDATAGGVLIGDQVDDRGGIIFGDPHLITFDNVSYDFQAAGEFILARATSGANYEVQARFTALSSAVSVTTAMATSVNGTTVSLQTNGSDGSLLIDGNETTILNGESVSVGAGTVSRTGRTIEIDHGNGDTTRVDIFSSFLNVTPSPSLARDPGSLEGLLGDADGNPGDDFQLADGTVLSTPLPIDMLYGNYAASWLVADGESLLPGATEQFSAPGRVVTIDSLPEALRLAAEAAVDAVGITNPILREAAILDFALTGNQEFIEAADLTDENFNPIVDTVAVDPINDPVIILTSNRTTFDEADTDTHTATLTVWRGSSEGDLTVNYDIVGNGASSVEMNDFVGGITSGEIIINDGEDNATFEVKITDDDSHEETESFDIVISLGNEQASSFELLVPSVRMSILDDDEESAVNEVRGTEGRDNLVGTPEDDVISSLGGSIDRMTGGQGADFFAFGAETLNGIRERDIILDYEVGVDSILLEDGATVGSLRQTSTGVTVFLEGDRDAIYVQGDGVLIGNLTFVPENALLA